MTGYWKAVRWIAGNDEPTLTDIEQVEDLMTVVMLADLSGKAPRRVAIDVVATRTGRSPVQVAMQFADRTTRHG